jgi:hypothetical protein
MRSAPEKTIVTFHQRLNRGGSVANRRSGLGTWALLALSLVLGACGDDSDAFTVTPEALEFSTTLWPNTEPPSKSLVLTVQSKDQVFFGAVFDDSATSPIANATIGITGPTTVAVTIFPKRPGALGQGTHTGTVVILGCQDAECNSQVAGSPKTVIVSYRIDSDVKTAPAELTFTQPQNISAPPGQDLAISPGAQGSSYTSWSAAFQAESGGDWLRVSPASGTRLPTQLRAEVQPLSQSGSYRGTVRLSFHTSTANNVSWVDVPVTYTVEASALTVTPGNPTFVLTPASTLAQLSQTVTLGGVGTTWSASSEAPWLQVSPSSGSSTPAAQVTLSVDPEHVATLAPGDSSTTITFSYSDAGSTKVLRVPVTVRTSLPYVRFVAPYIAVAGSTEEVVLRGSGFSALSSPQVRFGTVPASTVVPVSDTELRATHPPLAAGRYSVRVHNGSGLGSSRAWLVVQDPQPYARASVPGSGWKGRLVYDAERQALLVVNDSTRTIERYAYDRGTQTWAASTQLMVPGLADIALTPDGSELIALSWKMLQGLDPTTLAIRWSVTPSYNSSHDAGHSLAVANDGKVIILADSLYSFDLLTRKTTYLKSASSASGALGMAASWDGRRIVGTVHMGPVFGYDASTGQLLEANWDASGFVAMNRSGTKGVVSSTQVINGQLGRLGLLPFGGVVLTPDGSRAWSLSGSQLRLFNLLGGTASNGEYWEVGTSIAVQQISGLATKSMTLAPDGNTLFYSDLNGMFIQPLTAP